MVKDKIRLQTKMRCDTQSEIRLILSSETQYNIPQDHILVSRCVYNTERYVQFQVGELHWTVYVYSYLSLTVYLE